MQKTQGFSLIELMIVVAIVAILAAVAVPSYQSFVQEGRRAEGVALALDIASRQERYFTQSANYTDKAENLGYAASRRNGNNPLSENGYYEAVITGTAAGASNAISTYSISTEPSVADAECGNLILDNIGRRTSEHGDAAECWR